MTALVSVKDHGETLSFSWDSVYAYLGPTQIIASALVFRLFERAFRDLSPGAAPDRESMQFLAGFPGQGIAEAVELITRIRSRRPKRFTVDTEAGPAEASKLHPLGAMYFEVQIAEKRRGYWPPVSVFNDEFRKNVATWQGGAGSAEDQAGYLVYKKGVCKTVLEAPEENFFSFRDLPPLPWPAE